MVVFKRTISYKIADVNSVWIMWTFCGTEHSSGCYSGPCLVLEYNLLPIMCTCTSVKLQFYLKINISVTDNNYHHGLNTYCCQVDALYVRLHWF